MSGNVVFDATGLVLVGVVAVLDHTRADPATTLVFLDFNPG